MPVLHAVFSCCLSKDARIELLLINSFHELSDNKGHALYSFDLFLCSDKFALETPAEFVSLVIMSYRAGPLPLLVLDVLFLKIDVPGSLLATPLNPMLRSILKVPLELLQR